MLPELLTVDDAATYLKVRPKTVHDFVRQGKLACVQVSDKERRFTEEQLMEFLRNRTRAAIMPKPIDTSQSRKVRFPRKGGGKKSVEDCGADLGKEIRDLCR